MTGKDPRPRVGWRERVALPLLGIEDIVAKIDTGARSCALHAVRLHHFQREGEEWLRFTVPARRHRPAARVEARLVGLRQVKSSNGESQKRFVIRTRLRLGPRSFSTEITLTNRSQMGFAMLVGRIALRKRFLVDPAASFVHGRGKVEVRS